MQFTGCSRSLGRSKALICLLVTMWVFVSPYSLGLTYTNGIEQSSWRYDGSVFECSLTHNVPFYGEAVFKVRAGESSHFRLVPEAARLETGQASLILQPPAWRHNLRPIDLGFVPVKRGSEPVILDERYTERLLAELNTGYEIELTRMPWYGAEQSSRIQVSPIGFKDAYQRYLGCLGDLLPANFDQIRRTAIYFGSALFEPLPAEQKRKLDNIVTYCKADPSVTEFFIDGHTDSVGTRADNFVLSEKRANEVTEYLVSRGLPRDRISVRWHGERYPTAQNTTVEGRAKNRRVTIRLERDPALLPQGLNL